MWEIKNILKGGDQNILLIIFSWMIPWTMNLYRKLKEIIWDFYKVKTMINIFTKLIEFSNIMILVI